jgi:GNAT superfamily N-acetyltransferase
MATISRLAPGDFADAVPDLAGLLVDAVAGGASVGWPGEIDLATATEWWQGLGDRVAAGGVVILVASERDRVVGTAQLRLAEMPNQRHRADVAKLLVHRDWRRAGLGATLMRELETIALELGRTLLVLDTITGSPADALYRRLGWIEVGEIPGYALMGDGTLGPTTVFYRQLSNANPAG